MVDVETHSDMGFRFLVTGIDTLECAYFLSNGPSCQIDYGHLAMQKEFLRQSKTREPELISLGGDQFYLHAYGSSSGYPFIIENENFLISFGEFNSPSFFVKFKCRALWQHGAFHLHQRFLRWASSVGLVPFREETLSRIDFSFDYELSDLDFDENSFVSLSKKDTRYRKDSQLQTLQFGKGAVVLRVYDKVAEIDEQSNKHWFFDIWGIAENIWRIEWQVRKSILRRFAIRTFEDLTTNQGDLLRYLATEHDSLRLKTQDQNRSRWPLHPLWGDLVGRVNQMECVGIYREINQAAMLEERNTRMAISIYGYLKRMAAVDCVLNEKPMSSLSEAMEVLAKNLTWVHNRHTWEADVEKRILQIRLDRW